MLTPEAQVRVKNWAWSFLCPTVFLSSPCGSFLSYPTWKLLFPWLTLMEAQNSQCIVVQSLFLQHPHAL